MGKKKWLGALLNFLLPGLGQLYAQRAAKAILTYVLFLVVVFSVRFISYNFQLFVFAVAMIIGYYLYSIISGYRDIDHDKEYPATRLDKWYVLIAMLLLHWTIFNNIKGPLLDRLTPISFASIPTPAMSPALEVGDILAFKKVKSLERNDVGIFWFPEDIKTMYVKRCIGMPGDSLQIRAGKVKINGVVQKEVSLKFSYLVLSEDKINSRIFKENRVAPDDYFELSFNTYRCFLSEEQVQALRKLPVVKKVELTMANEDERENAIYPKSDSLNWNTDFYGPIYIPKKGDNIELTARNIDIYLKCIEFENESVQRIESGLKVNGELITVYTFKQNYFFMMGDNRHNSLDSRYWGLLPEELVIGKVMYLYWGATSERIGKKII